MNKRLEKQLNEYFYSEEYYKHIEDGEKLKAAYTEYYRYLEPLMQYDKELFYKIEDAISRAELEYERRGFLQGYQYALIMMGIAL